MEELLSDSDGFFKTTFEPEVPGDYKVVAEFEGTQAYTVQMRKLAISVTEAPQSTEEPAQPVSISEQYLLPGIVAIIVSIFVVGAVLGILIFKKK